MASCPYYNNKALKNYIIKKGARSGSRTRTPKRTHGPQPCLSTNSSTRANGAVDRSAKIYAFRGLFKELSNNYASV